MDSNADGQLPIAVACIFTTKDRFTIKSKSDGQQRVITRQDDPLIYWGTEFGIVFVAVSLDGCGVYRGGKKG